MPWETSILNDPLFRSGAQQARENMANEQQIAEQPEQPEASPLDFFDQSVPVDTSDPVVKDASRAYNRELSRVLTADSSYKHDTLQQWIDRLGRIEDPMTGMYAGYMPETLPARLQAAMDYMPKKAKDEYLALKQERDAIAAAKSRAKEIALYKQYGLQLKGKDLVPLETPYIKAAVGMKDALEEAENEKRALENWGVDMSDYVLAYKVDDPTKVAYKPSRLLKDERPSAANPKGKPAAWKPLNPQMGQEAAPAQGGMMSQEDFAIEFARDYGRAPSAREIKAAQGKYWR